MAELVAVATPTNMRTGCDFYRCYRCKRLITKLEEIEAYKAALRPNSKLILCPCGSLKYQPCNMRWYHWFFPRVLRFAWKRLRGLA